MVKRQHQRTSSSSTSAQIRKPSVTTRSRRNQNTGLVNINSIEQRKKFAFDMKRKRKSDNEAVTPEGDGGIDGQSLPSYSNNALVIQDPNILDTIKLEDNDSVSSPSKRAKLSTMVEYNDNQFDIDKNIIQTDLESKEIKLEKGEIREGIRQRNSVYGELRNGIGSKNMAQPSIDDGIENTTKDIENKNNKQEIVQSNDDEICNNIEMIIDNFKDVIEIRGTQMVIGNFVIEYSDYQEFLTLLNKLMDILEKYDSEKILQSAKKIGCRRNTGQILNLNLFRTKISKRAYKSLDEFQDDFTCTCNDAINANPEKRDIGMQFLKFGDRLFEQARKELPSSIRQLCDNDENVDTTKATKRQQKVALTQPTLDGHVFSSVAVKPIPGNNDFRLVGELRDMTIISSQSMDEDEIPTIGSILPKKEIYELPVPEERKIPGVKFHQYKAYASFAPTYDSSLAMLSYEDTVLTHTYKKHSCVSEDDSDLSEEEEEEEEDEDEEDEDDENLPSEKMVTSEEINQTEDFEIASSSKQNNPGDNISIENSNMSEKLFEDIDVDLLYKSVTENTQSDEKDEIDIDQILDENVEIFKKVQFMQEKRLITSNPNIISKEERELAIKLQNKLVNIISRVPPSDLVSFESIEYAMDNLPIKEKAFKGMLPPDKPFAHATNEVSRDAFGGFSGVEKASEDMEQAEYTRNGINVPMTKTKSEEALSHQGLARQSQITPHSVPHLMPQQSVSLQSLHRSIPHSFPASMTYPQPSRATAPQVPMRMSYGSQGMNTQMHASYQMTYPRPPPHVTPYYHPSQRYHPSYGYPYYPQYGGYPMNHTAWQQRPGYY